MNKVTFIGRAVKDPDVRYSGDTAVARFTLAVNRRFKKDGEPDADFFNCVAFGKTGVFVEKYMKKGRQYGICGRIQNRSWEDAEGKKRYATDIIVEEIDFCGNKDDGKDSMQKVADIFPGAEIVDDDEDCPF